MYDLPFIFDACGFGWVPPEIRHDLLYNVSYEPGVGTIKLYVLDESRRFLHKISQDGRIVRQYEARAAGADTARLERFLGASFDFNDLLIDTVEDDSFYLLIESTTPSQYIHFLTHLCEACRITRRQFVDAVNRINARPVENIHECCMQRAVSGVRVDLAGRRGKIYARPFLTGSGFDLGADTLAFLQRLFGTDAAGLREPLQHVWVASDLPSARVVVVTQRPGLLGSAE